MTRNTRQVTSMTDKDYEVLESIDPSERARLMKNKKTFKLGNEHMDMIANDLLADDDAKFGKIMRDLVTFVTTGENSLIDNIDESDKIDKTARRLLYDDCCNFTKQWLLKSYTNSQNAKKPRKTSKNQYVEEAAENTAEEDHESGDGHPSLDEVKGTALFNWQGSLPVDEIERIAARWYESMTKSNWRDDHGEDVKDWRALLDTYLSQAWKKRGER